MNLAAGRDSMPMDYESCNSCRTKRSAAPNTHHQMNFALT